MSQQSIPQSAGGAFLQQTRDAIQANFSELYGGLMQIGNVFFCDYVNGNDTANDGRSPAGAFKTLATAYGACVSGHNDCVVMIGDGGSTGTQRVDTKVTWAKNATHLFGWSPPLMFSHRARIAPNTTTVAAAGTTPYMLVSASGCMFSNFQLWVGFATGQAAQIGCSITGSRNLFKNVHFAGLADAASAADGDARILKIGTAGAGENVFDQCVIGVDSVARSAANAAIQFYGTNNIGTPRNVFKDCIFPSFSTATSPLAFYTTGNNQIDRENYFIRCIFANAPAGTGVATMAGLGTMAAGAGGVLLFKDCTLLNITEFGTDATTRGQVYVDGAAPTAATSGIAVNPT
jgi:hypothetical protein